MGATLETVDVGALPLAPKNPLPYRKLLMAVRVIHIGQEARRGRTRDQGGVGPEVANAANRSRHVTERCPRHPRMNSPIRFLSAAA
jgi:hypothetical protein